MVNEDIVTSLRNAVDRGESLETAMRVLINSGYPVNEVQDASKFVGFVPMSPNNKNLLIMPEEKNILIKNNPGPPVAQPMISGMPIPPKLPAQSQLQQIQQFSYLNPRYPSVQQLPQRTPTNSEIKSEISSNSAPKIQMKPPLISQQPKQTPMQIPRYPQPTHQPLLQTQSQPQIAQEAPEKSNYKKEIILLIILLFLIGVLISTILLRNKILAFFS
ncbi:hypothetical protein J4429_00135 [Candidatus Pacearchaeota archaeon]|nr:hypothetical protein [Candidatus Pacearchaeota archaeon]